MALRTPTAPTPALNPATVPATVEATADPMNDAATAENEPSEPRAPIALVVAERGAGATPLPADSGWRAETWSDPYAAVARLARGSRDVAAVILSLGALREGELAVIRTIKRYYPHIDVFVTDVGPHGTALAEAVIYGADGICASGLLHRFHAPSPSTPARPPASTPSTAKPPAPPPIMPPREDPPDSTQPVLTSEELQALLGDFEDDVADDDIE